MTFTLETAAGATSASDAITIVDTAIELLGERALYEISLDQIAVRAGLPLSRVTALFPDLGAVVVAAIREWNQRRMHLVADTQDGSAIAMLRNLLRLSLTDPACARVVFAAADIAGSPGHPQAYDLQQQWVRFHAVVQRALVNDIEAGREPETMNPASGAEQLLALYEGLQFQWLVRPHLDMVAAFDRAATRLRAGWAQVYTAPDPER